jgi:hypothetical protein
MSYVQNDSVSHREVEAAAKAYLEWQFPERTWESSPPKFRDVFMEGAAVILRAAAKVRSSSIAPQ